ncbi:ABC transporter permease [Actinosynnema sp. NPDC053489]|uniref:ABC transporter permease n=1 Tax=Actinosynnema sp. NPDC053489 TaxID=3363916 RepID=UPI0037CB7A71
MVAGLATNVAFGLLRMAVLTAAVGQTPIAGYDVAATTTYVWLAQGLITVVVLWGDRQLADRVRSGDVVVDLYRPWHLQSALLAEDVGRAGYAVLVRLAPPVAFGAVLFPFRWPSPAAWPAFAVSVALAVAVSFGMRFLLNATTFWLLDNRGVQALYTAATWVLCGLAVPLSFFPDWAVPIVWSTPFAAMLQAPVDVFLERGSPWPLLAGQASWAAAVLLAGHLVLRRAERKVVVQGG